jgi:hypothetical protein
MHVSDRPRDASITLIVKHRLGALRTPNFHPKIPPNGPQFNPMEILNGYIYGTAEDIDFKLGG